MHICSNCKTDKPLDLFYIRRDGLTEKPSSRCKACVAKKTKQRRLLLATQSQGLPYMTKNPCRRGHSAPRIPATGDCSECYRLRDAVRSLKRNKTPERKAYFENWRAENKEKIAVSAKRYAASEKGRTYAKDNFARRYVADSDFRVKCAIRNALKRIFLASGNTKRLKTQEILGYGPDELRARISCQFKNGMDWSNYGEWEIDHKIPIAVMFARGETRPEVINCLANLQPLWMAENRSKGARYAG